MSEAIELAKAYVQIIPSAKGMEKNLEQELSGKTEKAGSSAGKRFSFAFGSAAKLAGAAIAAGTTAAAGFAKSAVDAGSQFDASMAQVAATMGTTVDQIGDLRAFAQEMGSTTAFSASQAADALNYMALAGYDAETSMNMLPNVLNLAAAGGIELAYASDMVTDASSALGLDLEQTTKLVDQMATASSKSNTSVAQLGEAILVVGGTAKNLAGGTTELSTSLGILADNGIKGAEGGTALRNIILSLSAPTDKAAEKMEALGLEAYDSSGNLRPLNDIFEDLNGILGKMTQGEQTQVLNTLFNKVDLKSANALLANSGERFQELSGFIDAAKGSAEAMANTQLDNLAGDVTIFKSALEGAQIAVSDMLMPSLREFVQFGSQGLSRVTDAFKAEGLSGAMNALGSLIGEGTAKLTEGLPSFVDAGVELVSALVEGLIDAMPALAEAAGTIVTGLVSKLSAELPQMLSSGIELVRSLAGGIHDSMPEIISGATEIISSLLETLVAALPDLVGMGLELIVSLADGLIDALPQIAEGAGTIIARLLEAIVLKLPDILQMGVRLVLEIVSGLIKAIPQLLQAGGTLIDRLSATFTGFDWWGLGRDILNGIKQGILDAVGGLVEAAKSAGRTALNGVKSMLGIHSPSKVFAEEVGRNIPGGIAQGISRYSDMVADAMNEMSRSALAEFSPDVNVGLTPMRQASKDTETAAPKQEVRGDDFGRLMKEALADAVVMMDGERVGRLTFKQHESLRRRGLATV